MNPSRKILFLLVLLLSADAFACRRLLQWLGIWSRTKSQPVAVLPAKLQRLSDYDPPTSPWELGMAFGRNRPPIKLKDEEAAAFAKADYEPSGKAYGPDKLMDLTTLDTRQTYLWVISESGELIMGPRKYIQLPAMNSLMHFDFLGHPALLPVGATGRIAGELKRGEKGTPNEGKWVINFESGRFNVRQLDGKWEAYEDRGERSQKNALKMFLRAGADVTIEAMKKVE